MGHTMVPMPNVGWLPINMHVYMCNILFQIINMVRNKPWKTEPHGQTDSGLTKRVVHTVLEGRSSLRQIAKDNGIQKSTLQRYVKLARAKGGTGMYQMLWAISMKVWIYDNINKIVAVRTKGSMPYFMNFEFFALLWLFTVVDSFFLSKFW